MWGLDQGSALGLGSRPGVWLGVQNLGRVWGLGLRLSPESGRSLGSRSRFWVGVPNLAPGPQPSPGHRTALAPTAQATGSGAGQWWRGAARRGQWEAAGRKALEGGGRGAVAT